jgi:C4-type Zn-finger protein
VSGEEGLEQIGGTVGGIMKKCARCGYKLDEIDLKKNVCPVCEKKLDARRKDSKDDKRIKRPL